MIEERYKPKIAKKDLVHGQYYKENIPLQGEK